MRMFPEGAHIRIEGGGLVGGRPGRRVLEEKGCDTGDVSGAPFIAP